MSSSVNVRSPELLEEVRSGIAAFQATTAQVLQTASREAETTLAWLAERVAHWQREVTRRQEEVSLAAAALARCQASGSTDRDGHYHPPSCGAYEQALAQARRALAAAEAELGNARRWQQQLRTAFEQYQLQAAALERLRSGHLDKAKAFLSNKVAELEAYLGAAIGVGLLGPAFIKAVAAEYKSWRNQAGQYAVEQAKQQEIELIQRTGRGTRNWNKRQLAQLKAGQFPKGFHGHHINNVARFPDLATNPDNITFLSAKQHLAAHHGSWRNNTSGKMFNRKSLIVQWHK